MTTTLIYDERQSPAEVATDGADLWLNAADLLRTTGWEIKPEGICRDEACIIIDGENAALLRKDAGGQALNLTGFARLIGQPYAVDTESDAWYFGPPVETVSRLLDLQAPDFSLPDLDGDMHSLSEQRGKKVLLALWASWCGCRFDLPHWQTLRDELGSDAFEVITVSCDSKGRAAAEQWIRAVPLSYPSLLDEHHLVAELYNTRNVPAVFWIDEAGKIVRANDPIYVERRNRETGEKTVNEKYLNGVRDWVEKGPASIFVTDDSTTRQRIGEVGESSAQAMAHFRLGLYLTEQGKSEAGVAQFKLAHDLQPDNWNIKRQSWNLGDIERDYGTTIQQAVRGPIPFYPPLELPDPA